MRKRFADETSRRQDCEALPLKAERLRERCGSATASGSMLLTVLHAYEEIAAEAEEVLLDGQAWFDAEGSDEAYERFAAGQALAERMQADTLWVTEELCGLSKERIEELVGEEAGLAPYRSFLERCASARPVEAAEAVSAIERAGQSLEEAYQSLLHDAVEFPVVTDGEGKSVSVTWGSHRRLLSGEDRAFRRRVYEAMFGTLAKAAGTAASLYDGKVRQEFALARLRGQESVLAAVLERDRMEPTCYERLVEAVREHLPLHHRLTELRARMLGLSEVGVCDLFVPLSPPLRSNLSLEEAQEILLEAVAPLGFEYQQRVRESFEAVFADPDLPVEYAANVYNRMPYVLVAYNGSMFSLLTLAHEVGHAVHMRLTNESQPYVYAEVPAVPSEAAALVHEQLVLRHLLKRAETEAERRSLLALYLDRFQNALFKQTMLSEFEHEAHQAVQAGEVLSAEAQAERLSALQEMYYGPGFAVDDLSGHDWLRAGHLFMQPYYVYAYGIACAAAAHVVEALEEDGAWAAKYQAFLQAGSSLPPADLLRMIEADPAERGLYERAFQAFARLIEEWEAAGARMQS